MQKRFGLIMARMSKGLTKKQVADGAEVEYQRYNRIEADTNVKVDVEEAYKIAAFLGEEHPKDIFLTFDV